MTIHEPGPMTITHKPLSRKQLIVLSLLQPQLFDDAIALQLLLGKLLTFIKQTAKGLSDTMDKLYNVQS